MSNIHDIGNNFAGEDEYVMNHEYHSVFNYIFFPVKELASQFCIVTFE